MDGAAAAGADAHAKLLERGYVVLEGLISADEVARLWASLEALMARERAEPFDPGDGPAYVGEDEHVESMARYLRRCMPVTPQFTVCSRKVRVRSDANHFQNSRTFRS